MQFTANGSSYAWTYQGTIYRSTDDGTFWLVSGQWFKDKYICAVVSNTAGHLIAGTYNDGIFRSTDKGSNRVHLTDGKSIGPITLLAINSPGYISHELTGVDLSVQQIMVINGLR